MASAGKTRSSGYKKLKEKMEIAQIISIVCLSIGGVLFAVCILVWVLRSFVRTRAQAAATVLPGRRGVPGRMPN